MNLTLEKGLKVLECLAGRAEPMSVGAIAAEVDSNKSTVFRMLETLKARGYVEQEYQRGDYRAGLQVLTLSADILDRMELRRKAGPYLHRLAEATGCSIYLAADSNGTAVMIMTEHPGGQVRAALGEIGHVSAVNYTAMGKLIGAFSSAETIGQILRTTDLVKRTPSTITDRKALLADFETIRSTGLALSRYENSADTYGIAVPVRNFEGTVIAALGLAVNRDRVADEGAERFEEALREAGEQLSFALGYAAKQLI